MSNHLTTYWKLHKVPIILVALSLFFYGVFAHQLLRSDFVKLLTLFAALFFLCFKLIQFEKWNLKFLLVAGLLFRIVFFTAEPNLSQDYFRFIWDGELVGQFMNPYLDLPSALIDQKDHIIANAHELYQGMGSLSANHYSNYPPLNQLFFLLAGILGGKSIIGSVVAMRFLIIAADLGIFYFGRKLLRTLNRSPHMIYWYFLNPLVIIELTGNLHFEGVMLFFFVWAMYLLSVNKLILGGAVYALSISVKLVPLLFLPLFLKYLGTRRSMPFYLAVGVTTLALWLPFYAPEFVANYTNTLGLWFTNFEFNAGIYNGIKHFALQFEAKPWELIKSYGRITPIVTLVLVALFTFLPNNKKLSTLFTSMLWLLTLYYFMSTTIHPWYLIFLLVLSLFTEFRFAMVWSAVVILSYFAYSQTPFKEHMGLIAIEYIVVFGFIVYEIVKLKGKKLLFNKN